MTRLVAPGASFVVVTASAELILRLAGTPSWLIPRPSQVATAMWHSRAVLSAAAGQSLASAATGFVLAAAVGFVLATTMATSRILERAISPYTVFFQTVPIVAVAPLLVLWFGAGFRAVAVAAFVVAVFPVIAATLHGMKSVDPGLLDLFDLYGAGFSRRLFGLLVPWALPSLFTGLRVAAGLAVIGAIVGEFVAGFAEGRAGLGITILAAHRQLRTDVVFAAVLLSCGIGLVMVATVDVLAHRVLRGWHASERLDRR